MSCQFKEVDGLEVTVDAVVFTPELDAPPDHPFPFVYHITISNQSSETVTIRGRKWVVTDSGGEVIVVEGDGVVGCLPRIEPGEQFQYQSCHTIARDSIAEGSYFGILDDGTRIRVPIPRFEMIAPA